MPWPALTAAVLQAPSHGNMLTNPSNTGDLHATDLNTKAAGRTSPPPLPAPRIPPELVTVCFTAVGDKLYEHGGTKMFMHLDAYVLIIKKTPQAPQPSVRIMRT